MIERRLVYVEWVDSSELYGWTKPANMLDESLMCYSVGWLMEESHDRIVLCSSISLVVDKDDPRGSGTIGIPKVAIKKMRTVKLPTVAKVWK